MILEPNTEPIIVRTQEGTFVEPDTDVGLLVAVDTEKHARIASLNLRKFLSEGLERAHPTHDWICWLLNKRNTPSHECEDGLGIPHCDHPRAFRNPRTKERVVIHQPYVCHEDDSPHCISCQTLIKDSEIFAEKHRLIVLVSQKDTFYYPSATALVEYRVKK
jgi:hypothetical protein